MQPGSADSQKGRTTFHQTRLFQALKAVLVVGLLGGASGLAHAAPDKPWKEGQILVKPKAGLPEGEFDKILQTQATRSSQRAQIGDRAVHIVASRRNPKKPSRVLFPRTPTSSLPNSTWP